MKTLVVINGVTNKGGRVVTALTLTFVTGRVSPGLVSAAMMMIE